MRFFPKSNCQMNEFKFIITYQLFFTVTIPMYTTNLIFMKPILSIKISSTFISLPTYFGYSDINLNCIVQHLVRNAFILPQAFSHNINKQKVFK